jgi:hypothetical protein
MWSAASLARPPRREARLLWWARLPKELNS